MEERFLQGETFQDFLDSVQSHETLWHQIYERAELPPEAEESAAAIRGDWNLLVLAEDWCGDAVHVLPYLARLEEAFPHFQLRILSRDQNPDIMDAHLTNGARSIPVVMVLDDEFREVAWWGPRPGPLQELFLAEIKHLSKEERFPRIRAWFARDRGRTTLAEILGRIPVSV
ncbi:MAG: thioredoxin family protein [Gemmatimonadetes bacterium]|nr:thioredoxin family protein [Gemmatimonadota bacterium]NNM05887.1 thioredoxin family protein [Gemmatimonadota bacterium]